MVCGKVKRFSRSGRCGCDRPIRRHHRRRRLASGLGHAPQRSPRLPDRLPYPGLSAEGRSGHRRGPDLYSRDGKAKLLIGAFENDEQNTIAACRDYVLRENYPGAALDYASVHDRWFVLSGTIGDREFYERVSFTCGGRLINSWAMIYPKAENQFYDRVVEAVSRTYSPGAGRSGNCD
jgi:hypothetical protein